MNKKSTFLIIVVFLINTQLQAQWVKTNGPEGITITSFFNEDSILLCGTQAQGVYRSYDHGNSWLSSNQGIRNRWIHCFEQDATYIYAGTLGEGVFRSADHGHSWQAANNGMPTEGVYCLLRIGQTLFAGTVTNGLFASHNQGASWAPVPGAVSRPSFIKAMTYVAPRLMVEADNYIYFSNDLGVTWDVDQDTTQFYQIYEFFHKGDTVLAAALNNVFRSTDGGVSWSNPYQLPQNSSVVGFERIADTIYAGTAIGVYKSTDWGASWMQVSATGLRPGALDFIRSGNNFILGRQETGIAVSADTGHAWTQLPLSQFARASTLNDAMVSAHGILYCGTHGNGVFSSPDFGDTWTKIGTSNQFDTLSQELIFSMLHVEPNILFAGGGPDGLYRSEDNGGTWTHITAGLPHSSTNFTLINTLAQCGPNILASTTVGIYYSTDVGLTWHPTNLTGSSILDAGGFAVRDSIVCAGITAFTTSSQTGIYRSTDYGIHWTLAEPVLDNGFLAAGGNHTMYGGYLTSAYVSYDDGLTWFGISGIGAAFSILAWDKYAFIGNNTGVYFSQNYGANWTLVNQGMDPYPNNAVQGLTRDNKFVYAGTFRDAVWRRPLSDFGITIVPAAMGDLKARYASGIGKLYWQTFSEANLDHFEIERSTNPIHCLTTGKVTASGNSNSIINYSFDDKDIMPGINYYRLKIVDIDGKFTYSNVVSLEVTPNSVAGIFPDPFMDEINLVVSSEKKQLANIRLMDNAGRSVKIMSTQVNPGVSTIHLTGLDALAKGLYILEVQIGNEATKVYKVVK